MTKTNEEIVCTYKKESNPNKKVKLLVICHLLKNKKTVTEVSKILFKAYNTIKNWWQAFKKDGIRGLETKKNTWPSAKDQKQNTFGVYGDKDKGRTVYCS